MKCNLTQPQPILCQAVCWLQYSDIQWIFVWSARKSTGTCQDTSASTDPRCRAVTPRCWREQLPGHKPTTWGLSLTGSAGLQHPLVPSLRRWMDSVWISDQPSGQDCERQRDSRDQHHQSGEAPSLLSSSRDQSDALMVQPSHSSVRPPQATLSAATGFLSVLNSVTFTPVSAAAATAYRAMPTIDAKLPSDFFFPFVWMCRWRSTSPIPLWDLLVRNRNARGKNAAPAAQITLLLQNKFRGRVEGTSRIF